ncbi:ABC transporter permease [Aeromicrobium terrae]|uniref:ABC transporter permease n=1 Tax=Aeromicrobium terrae TaxID=2498846 RepID=A0A5C8NKT9_9ACTN|nr:ABC transporter permease [Aeromicrobium terrae]TXL61858.1 ABC transporter permease [Aeromicrobium terrae]
MNATHVLDVTRAQLFALVRRPAAWTIVAALAVLNQVFSFLIPYISYRSSDPSGFDAGATPEELLRGTLPAEIVPNTLGGFPVFAGALTLAFGAILLGSEYGWGTFKTIATQRPSRMSILAGQVLTIVTAVAAIVALLFVLSAVTSTAIALGEDRSTALPSVGHLANGYLGGVLILSVWALVGGVLAVALRSVALPVGLGIVWALGIENLVSAMADSVLDALQPVRDVFPGVNAGSLVAALTPEQIGTPPPGVSDAVSGGRAVATLVAYLVVAVLAGAWFHRHRDVS